MSGKKLSIFLIAITFALGTGFAAFATDHRDDSGDSHHYECGYDDGGHMNGSHYGHMGSNHDNQNDYMSRYMDDH